MNTNVITFVSEGAIIRNSFVMPGSAARSVVQADGATKKLLGVYNYPKAAVTGDQVGIVVSLGEIVEITLGGTVTAGAYLTSDSAGKAVATTTAGQVVRGIALSGGDSGDIIKMLMTYFHHKA